MYILIFGMTAEEMEQAGQGSMITSLGAGQLSKMITSQLNRTLGSTLNLDYIEVSSADNWQSASFVVGTYITNDLFVTYQRGFGESEGDEITPSEVSLEYQLNQLVCMRLRSGDAKSSGLDAILKFEENKKKNDRNN
jgi:autotransporter translocation and assembly factor TamB